MTPVRYQGTVHLHPANEMGEFIEGRNQWEMEMYRPIPTARSIAVNDDEVRGLPEQRTMGEGKKRWRRALFPTD